MTIIIIIVIIVISSVAPQVIALSTNDGIIEFVADACNLSAILKDPGVI